MYRWDHYVQTQRRGKSLTLNPNKHVITSYGAFGVASITNTGIITKSAFRQHALHDN